MRLLDWGLRRLIRRGELTIIDSAGRRWSYGVPDPGRDPVVIRFTDPALPRKLVVHPPLALGEAYMDGRVVFEAGDILGLVELITANARWEDKQGPRSRLIDRASRMRGWLADRNSERRARRNSAHHYDMGNRLYELFLDRDMQYSCAYFADAANSLDRAQADKKAHIAAKLCLEPDMRVLDIGCGWGGMAIYLHQASGAEVLGVTLSAEQVKMARERAEAAGVAAKVSFKPLDYRQIEGRFDRIVSVGMFEHVGAAHYRQFFGKCRELLAPDGIMLLHTIGRFDTPTSGDAFLDRYIFPGYHIPTLSQLLGASEDARLITADVETLRLHYAYTALHWLRRARTAMAEIKELHGERFARMWEYYLCGAVGLFEHGSGCVFQVQYLRDRNAAPITRDYMLDEERRLRSLAPPDILGTAAPVAPVAQ